MVNWLFPGLEARLTGAEEGILRVYKLVLEVQHLMKATLKEMSDSHSGLHANEVWCHSSWLPNFTTHSSAHCFSLRGTPTGPTP